MKILRPAAVTLLCVLVAAPCFAQSAADALRDPSARAPLSLVASAVVTPRSTPAAVTAGAYVDTPGVRDARLQILRQERADTQLRLAEASKTLAKAPDPLAAQAASAAVGRLQSDMNALDREITTVESQHPTSSSQLGRASTPSGQRKPAAASAAGLVAQGSASAAVAAPSVAAARASFEPWDVFRNFGQTGNNP